MCKAFRKCILRVSCQFPSNERWTAYPCHKTKSSSVALQRRLQLHGTDERCSLWPRTIDCSLLKVNTLKPFRSPVQWTSDENLPRRRGQYIPKACIGKYLANIVPNPSSAKLGSFWSEKETMKMRGRKRHQRLKTLLIIWHWNYCIFTRNH